MKKNNRNILIIIAAIVAIVIGVLFVISILNDKNRLSVAEKKWLSDNEKTIQNINIKNDLNVFSNAGSGVYYDFINDFEKEYSININPITYTNNSNASGLNFTVKTNITDNDLVFYEDHYVLVSKNNELISSIEEFKDMKIGILQDDNNLLDQYINDVDVNYTSYDNRSALLTAFSANTDINYMIVPLFVYNDSILKSNYNIIYHLSNIKNYYVLSGSTDNTLFNIMKKYYSGWNEDKKDAYLNKHNLTLYSTNLNITEKELDSISANVYNYGFVNNSPYEVLMSGNFGGIVATYLKSFSDFADTEFNFTRYKTYDKFMNAVNDNNLDLYFNYYRNVNSNYQKAPILSGVKYSVIAKYTNSLAVHSVNSLKGKTVYAKLNSIIAGYLESVGDINVKTYSSTSELIKESKDDIIIVLDENVYNYYASRDLDDYTERYCNTIDESYGFMTKDNSTFYKLFSKYIASIDPFVITNIGLNNHNATVHSGTILGRIASYILYIIAILLVALFIVYRYGKKIKISKRIKKEDKLKYIDQLTSLKNRNYLNENKGKWNKNNIYPQAAIIIDLNSVQTINDTYGYEKGDEQIKAAANILIKTQLDNSDIIRTDGNEFLVYLIDYSEKQVVSYARKLFKEFKTLPFEYGAAIGYSMITDNLKNVEDAMNEAVENMKAQKEIINKEE